MPETSQTKVLEVIKSKTIQTNERYEGYQLALIKTLNEVMTLESNPPHNVVQQVSRKVTAVAENLVKEKGDTE